MFLLTSYTSTNGVLELIGMLFIFILILLASYYTSKWIGKANMVTNKDKNITIVETFRLAPSKYIQILKVGKRYLVVGVSKEHIEMLTELNEEDITLNSEGGSEQLPFHEVFQQVKKTWGDKIKKDENKD